MGLTVPPDSNLNTAPTWQQEDVRLQPTNWLVQMCQGCQHPGQEHQYYMVFIHQHPGQQHVKTNMSTCHSTSSTLLLKVRCLYHVGLAVVRKGGDLEEGMSGVPRGDGRVAAAGVSQQHAALLHPQTLHCYIEALCLHQFRLLILICLFPLAFGH